MLSNSFVQVGSIAYSADAQLPARGICHTLIIKDINDLWNTKFERKGMLLWTGSVSRTLMSFLNVLAPVCG